MYLIVSAHKSKYFEMYLIASAHDGATILDACVRVDGVARGPVVINFAIVWVVRRQSGLQREGGKRIKDICTFICHAHTTDLDKHSSKNTEQQFVCLESTQ